MQMLNKKFSQQEEESR